MNDLIATSKTYKYCPGSEINFFNNTDFEHYIHLFYKTANKKPKIRFSLCFDQEVSCWGHIIMVLWKKNTNSRVSEVIRISNCYEEQVLKNIF